MPSLSPSFPLPLSPLPSLRPFSLSPSSSVTLPSLACIPSCLLSPLAFLYHFPLLLFLLSPHVPSFLLSSSVTPSLSLLFLSSCIPSYLLSPLTLLYHFPLLLFLPSPRVPLSLLSSTFFCYSFPLPTPPSLSPRYSLPLPPSTLPSFPSCSFESSLFPLFFLPLLCSFPLLYLFPFLPSLPFLPSPQTPLFHPTVPSLLSLPLSPHPTFSLLDHGNYNFFPGA